MTTDMHNKALRGFFLYNPTSTVPTQIHHYR